MEIVSNNKVVIKKEDLERYYMNERKSISEISRIYNCDRRTVESRLKKYKIIIRPYGSFLVNDDGESLNLKYNRNEISASEYQNGLIKDRGYDNRNDYLNDLVKDRGYKNVGDYNRDMDYKRGQGTGLSMSENKECSSYLGVYICENKEFLSKIINIVENMSNNNPGYDVVCGRGKKIDIKCSCLIRNNEWNFHIFENKVADYFLMIAFDNRENLNVQHIWLVNGDTVIEKTNAYRSKKFIVNEKDIISINKGNRALKRWKNHEITDTYKLEEAQKLCDNFKNDIN